MEKDTHAFIIKEAVRLLKIRELKQNQDSIIKGNNYADLPVIKINGIRYTLGARNHFYNPETKKGFPLGVNAKSHGEKHFEKALNFYKEKKKERSFKHLGIACHLIADLSCPSHTYSKIPPPGEDELEAYIENTLSNIEIRKLNLIKNDNLTHFEDISRISHIYKTGKAYSIMEFLTTNHFLKKNKYLTPSDLEEQTSILLPLAIEYTASLMDYFYTKIKED